MQWLNSSSRPMLNLIIWTESLLTDRYLPTQKCLTNSFLAKIPWEILIKSALERGALMLNRFLTITITLSFAQNNVKYTAKIKFKKLCFLRDGNNNKVGRLLDFSLLWAKIILLWDRRFLVNKRTTSRLRGLIQAVYRPLMRHYRTLILSLWIDFQRKS